MKKNTDKVNTFEICKHFSGVKKNSEELRSESLLGITEYLSNNPTVSILLFLEFLLIYNKNKKKKKKTIKILIK